MIDLLDDNGSFLDVDAFKVRFNVQGTFFTLSVNFKSDSNWMEA